LIRYISGRGWRWQEGNAAVTRGSARFAARTNSNDFFEGGSMRRTNSTGSFKGTVWLFTLMAAPALQAGGPEPYATNWDNVKTVTPGGKTQIVLKDKNSYRGKYQTASDEAIVVRLETGDQTFFRQDVLRVSTKGESHRLRNALIGAGVGAGVGLGLGAAADSACNQNCLFSGKSWGKEVVTPVGAIIGAGVGAALPTGRWHDVYRAP
jgi:hypothetical protein